LFGGFPVKMVRKIAPVIMTQMEKWIKMTHFQYWGWGRVVCGGVLRWGGGYMIVGGG